MKAGEFLKCITISVAIVLHSVMLCAGNGDPPGTATPSNLAPLKLTTVTDVNSSGVDSANRPKPSDLLSIITDPKKMKELEAQRDGAAATRSLNEVNGASTYAFNPYEHKPLAAVTVPEQTKTGEKTSGEPATRALLSKDAPSTRALPGGSGAEQTTRAFPFDSPFQSASDPHHPWPDQTQPSSGSFGGPTSYPPYVSNEASTPPLGAPANSQYLHTQSSGSSQPLGASAQPLGASTPPLGAPANSHYLHTQSSNSPHPPQLASSYSSSGPLPQSNDLNKPASPSQIDQYMSTAQQSSYGSVQPHHLQSSTQPLGASTQPLGTSTPPLGAPANSFTPQLSSHGSVQPHHLPSSSGVGYQQGKPSPTTTVSPEAAAYKPPNGSSETNTYGVYGDPTQPLPPQTTPTSPTAPHYPAIGAQNYDMSRPPGPPPPSGGAPPRLRYSQWTPRQLVDQLERWHAVLFDFNALSHSLAEAIHHFQEFLLEFTSNLGDDDDKVLEYGTQIVKLILLNRGRIESNKKYKFANLNVVWLTKEQKTQIRGHLNSFFYGELTQLATYSHTNLSPQLNKVENLILAQEAFALRSNPDAPDHLYSKEEKIIIPKLDNLICRETALLGKMLVEAFRMRPLKSHISRVEMTLQNMYLSRCSAGLVVELFDVYKDFVATYNGIQARMIPPPFYTSWFKGKDLNQLNFQMRQEEYARNQHYRDKIDPNAKQNASELEMFRALMYYSYTGEGKVKSSYYQPPQANFQAYGQSILSPHESQDIVQYQQKIMEAKKREEELHRCQQIQAENKQQLPHHCHGLLHEFAQTQGLAQGQTQAQAHSQAHMQHTPQSAMSQAGGYPLQSPMTPTGPHLLPNSSPGAYTPASPTTSHFAHQQQQASPFYTPPTELRRIYGSEPSSPVGGNGSYGYPASPQSYSATPPQSYSAPPLQPYSAPPLQPYSATPPNSPLYSPSYMPATGYSHAHDPRATQLQRQNSASYSSSTYPSYPQTQPSSPWRPVAQHNSMPGGFAIGNHIY